MTPLMDLHMHTLFSDGQLSPSQLISLAKEKGVDIMCITDHDTVKGVMDMLTLSVDGITVLSGIEMSNQWNNIDMIHITGYFPKSTDFAELQDYLDKNVAGRRVSRCRAIVDKLIEDGIHITWEGVLGNCTNCLPSRPRIAETLMNNGYGSSIAETFENYLTESSKYYIPSGSLSPKESIDLIHKYGGIACLAHPWLLSAIESVLNHVVECGIDGMECFPPFQKEVGSDFYFQFSQQNHLISTSGSDYHGSKANEIWPGENIFPEDVRAVTLEYFKKHFLL